MIGNSENIKESSNWMFDETRELYHKYKIMDSGLVRLSATGKINYGRCCINKVYSLFKSQDEIMIKIRELDDELLKLVESLGGYGHIYSPDPFSDLWFIEEETKCHLKRGVTNNNLIKNVVADKINYGRICLLHIFFENYNLRNPYKKIKKDIYYIDCKLLIKLKSMKVKVEDFYSISPFGDVSFKKVKKYGDGELKGSDRIE